MSEIKEIFPASSIDKIDPLLECLSIISGFFDRPSSTASLKVGMPLENGKFTPDLFIRAAERISIEALEVSKEFESLTNDIVPCVLLLKDNDACVLLKIDEKHAEVIFPGGKQNVRSIPCRELKKRYDGRLLLTHSRWEEQPGTGEPSDLQKHNWFWGTLLQFWPIYSQVIITSIFINLFTLASTVFVMAVYDRVVPNNAISTLWFLALGVLIVFIFDFILRVIRGYFLDVAGKNADILLASQIYEHMLRKELMVASVQSLT